MRRKAAFGQNESEMNLNVKLGDAFVNHKGDCQLRGTTLYKGKEGKMNTLYKSLQRSLI